MPDLQKLKLAIDLEASDAYGSTNDSLNGERAKSLDYYLGRPLGTEVEGRSQIVSHDVMDTIEWQKPALLKMFAGGDQIVKFNPIGPEDVDSANQETEYINYVLTQKNDWFPFCYEWITDALLTRNAYALAYWDENLSTTIENYQGLSDDQLAFILKDIESGRLQVVGHSQQPAGPPQQVMTPMGPQVIPPQNLHDLQVRKIGGSAFARICCLPPERCLVSQRLQSMSLQDASYFEYFEMKTISELREMGFDVPDSLAADAMTDSEEVDQARSVGDVIRTHELGKNVDPAMKRVRVRMIWIRHDYNEDGIAELNYVIRVGKEFLHVEEVDTLPVASIVPTIMPHRHIGLSTSDNVHDIQEVNTMLIRGMIDNLYLANSGQYAISNKVNLEDMLTSRPGGIKRVDTDAADVAGHLMPFAHPIVMDSALKGLEFTQQMREQRTGTSRYTQGADLNALNRTASGISQLSSAASQRLELVARVIACGMKELFRIVHELTLKHSRVAETVELNNQWIPIDPRQWKKRSDMTVAVGLGVNSRDQSLTQLNLIYQQQLNSLPLGFIRPENVYHTFTEMVKAAGFPAAERFATDPRKSPPPKPQPDPIEVGKLKIAEFDAQTKRQALQLQTAEAKQEPVENARDRKLDLMIEMLKIQNQPAKPTAEGEKPAPQPAPNFNINLPDIVTDRIQEIDEKLRTELDQNMTAMQRAFHEQLGQVREMAQKKRKLVPIRGKRGRIERIEEQD